MTGKKLQNKDEWTKVHCDRKKTAPLNKML